METQEIKSRKVAIPRKPEGRLDHSPPRFDRRVRRACDSCRQRKTRCSGNRLGCKNCEELGISCHYTDGKRERSKKLLADLSDKVRTYEEVIQTFSLNWGVSVEDLVRSVTERAGEILFPGARLTYTVSSGDGTEIEEDFDRDHFSRAIGYVGRSSVISWLHRLSRQVNAGYGAPRAHDAVPVHGESSYVGYEHPYPSLSVLSYYVDCVEIPLVEVDAYGVPPARTANKLLKIYLLAIHPSFPIIGISTFISQYQYFFNGPSIGPRDSWLAVLNLVFALASLYTDAQAESQHGKEDHLVYFSRARSLSTAGNGFDHLDLQQVQVEGLTSRYLLDAGQINRACRFAGNALRGAVNLGLHLKNVGTYVPDTSKEIRYRVWWSLYIIDHTLSTMMGRPAFIDPNGHTTPLPIPFNESEFHKGEVVHLLRDQSRNGLSLSSVAHPDGPGTSPHTGNGASWLRTTPPSMSLYFFYLVTLTSIARRATTEIYSDSLPVKAPWRATESTIRNLTSQTDTWRLRLPKAYDFTGHQYRHHLHTSGATQTQTMSLALMYYSTKLVILWPGLSRLEQCSLGEQPMDETIAAECIKAACQMLDLLPDTPDRATFNKIPLLLHSLVQTTVILLMGVSFHRPPIPVLPGRANEILQASSKAVGWLHALSDSSPSAHRAWQLCDNFWQQLAPQVHVSVSTANVHKSDRSSTVPYVDLSTTESAPSSAATDGFLNPFLNPQVMPPVPPMEQPPALPQPQPQPQPEQQQAPSVQEYIPNIYGWLRDQHYILGSGCFPSTGSSFFPATSSSFSF